MSQHALKAVLAAVASDVELKSRLLDESARTAALAEVLSLSADEESELVQTLSSDDTSEPVETDIDERNNPGPGSTGR